MGRPPKLSHALIDAVCDSLETGAPITVCARRHGFDRTTYHAWREQGRLDLAEGRRTLHAVFTQRVTESEALGELGYWEDIREGARAGSRLNKDGKPVDSPRRVAAKVQSASVALKALRTRWGRRYKTFTESQRMEPRGEGEPLPPAGPPPGEEEGGALNPAALSPEERRLYLKLKRKLRGLPEE